MGFLLYVIAAVLFFIVSMLNAVVVLWKNIRVRGFFRAMSTKFRDDALNIDVFANEAFPVLWNTTLRKRGTYQFGKKETLSSVLGKLCQTGGLSWAGKALVFVLTEKHCIDSINLKIE